jgi:hypothetical protein
MRDEETNMTYHVMAYRQLSDGEIIQTIREYHNQPKNRRRKKPERNKEVVISTFYGARQGL